MLRKTRLRFAVAVATLEPTLLGLVASAAVAVTTPLSVRWEEGVSLATYKEFLVVGIMDEFTAKNVGPDALNLVLNRLRSRFKSKGHNIVDSFTKEEHVLVIEILLSCQQAVATVVNTVTNHCLLRSSWADLKTRKPLGVIGATRPIINVELPSSELQPLASDIADEIEKKLTSK